MGVTAEPVDRPARRDLERVAAEPDGLGALPGMPVPVPPGYARARGWAGAYHLARGSLSGFLGLCGVSRFFGRRDVLTWDE